MAQELEDWQRTRENSPAHFRPKAGGRVFEVGAAASVIGVLGVIAYAGYMDWTRQPVDSAQLGLLFVLCLAPLLLLGGVDRDTDVRGFRKKPFKAYENFIWRVGVWWVRVYRLIVITAVGLYLWAASDSWTWERLEVRDMLKILIVGNIIIVVILVLSAKITDAALVRISQDLSDIKRAVGARRRDAEDDEDEEDDFLEDDEDVP